MTSYPITIHTRGTTYSRAGLYALPAGTWTASAVVRKPDGTLIETLAVNFAALSVPDAAGNTHALSVLATATQTALWPLAALLQDVLFTDASTTPVIVPAVTTIITVSAHTAPINEADNPLQTISPDLAPVLRGEQGPAGDAAAGAVTSVAGRTGAVTLAKGDVGLGSVDNTSDASKPVSTAQAAADAAVQAAAAADATSKANAAAAAAVAALGTAAALNVPATGDAAAGEVVKGTDSRLSDARTPTAHNQSASTISDSTATGRAVLTALDAAAARTAIGAGTSSFDGAYASLSGKPTLGTAAATASTDYTPAAHVGAGGTAHANAVAAGAAGFMTGADKSKLDGIAAGATVAPTTTDALTEGSTNLYSTAARIRATVLTGLSTAAGTVVAATHTVLEAIGFLQKQVSDNTTAIAGKQATLVSATNIKTINGNTLLGSGDLTVSGGGGTPGGSTTQVQYNNAGAFAGSGNLVYDGAASLDVGSGSTTSQGVRIGNAGLSGWSGIGTAGSAQSAGSTTGVHWTAGRLLLSTTSGSIEFYHSGSCYYKADASGFCPESSTYLGKPTARWVGHFKSINILLTSKTADYTSTSNDGTLTFDASGAARTCTLETAVGAAGRIKVIVKTDSSANTVTIDPNATETINGASTLVLSSQWDRAVIQSDGTNWIRIA